MSFTCLCSAPPLSAQSGTPTYQLLNSFGTRAPGSSPGGELIQGKDGLLYGGIPITFPYYPHVPKWDSSSAPLVKLSNLERT